MTGDLQASVEFAVEFQTFHNVDLFQRGYYQIRCSVKPPVKVPTSIELEQKVDAETEVRGNEYQFPAMTSLSGQTAISKTFQILYRNETIVLNDIFVFRLNMLVNSDKIVQEIDQADFQMTVELFFSDSDYGSDITDSMASVSSQTLKLHMSCVKGLHHHVPILFDYYHFAVIDTTIHATMTGLGLPDNSVVRPGKNSWFAKPPSNVRVSTPTFFVTLFSNKALAPSSSKTSLVEKQLQFAYDTHRSLCSTLLSAQINLLAYFQCLSELLPDNQRINIDMVDFGEKLDELCSSVEATVACEETFSQVCSNLNNLSTELHLAWSQFLEFFTLNKATFPFLRTEHHNQRISHLSEAFFVKEHQWDELQKPQDQNTFQQHQSLAQSVKGSRYYQCIPPVQVECPLLDGDTSSIPIIFEDKYSFTLSSETDPGSNTELDDILFTLDQDEVDNIGDESYLVISDNGSDEADDNSATSQDVSEKGVQGTDTEQTVEGGSTVEEPNETKTASLEEAHNAGKENSAQCDSSAEPPGEAAQSQGEAAQPQGEATQPQGEAAQPHGEAAQSIESDSENERSDSKEQLVEEPDTSSVHEKTDSAVTEEAEKKRTSEVQISDECENDGSSDTEESDFVDAEALNGVEMLPSSLGEEVEGVSGDNATKETTKTDDSEGQTSSESKGASNENVALPTVTDSEDQNGENENSNVEDTEEPELLLTTDGSEDDLLPSSTDVAADADSSNYETPRSSEASPSTTSDSPTEVATTQPTVNGAPSGTSETDNVPVAPRRKKKKAVPKGLSSSSLGACFPMNCAGNTSPAFNLSRGESVYGGSVRSRFEIAKRFVKRSLNYACQIYSDRHLEGNREPYFSAQPPDSLQTHLIVCVHGLDGNSGDLRLLRCYLEMGLPSTRMDFLMSEINQPDTFVTFEEMTDKLVQEIAHHIEAYNLFPTKISFIGHSLGNIIIRSALTHPEMRPFLDKVHTFLSLSGPHLGMLYPTSSLVSTGLWFMQKWKKSDSLLQLSLHDHPDPRQTFIYRLSRSEGLQYFKNILLVSSVQDHYVPYHSARIEPCRQATRDNSEIGIAYREMIDNLLKPLEDRKDMNFVRYSVYHNLPSSANSLIGRAAHIAMLDSELFIEKLLLVSAVDYFR